MNSKKRMTALCMAAALIFGFIPLYVSGIADNASENEINVNGMMDYTDGAGEPYAELSAADVLRLTAGVTVTAAEEEYLSVNEIKLKYSDKIPDGSVTYKKTNVGYTVDASPYSYTAQNGETVDLIPLSVTVDGVTVTFSDGKYEAEFTGLKDGQTYEITTCYKAEIAIPFSALTALANAAYDEGQRVIAKRKVYDDALAAYEQYESEHSALIACRRCMEALESAFIYDSERHMMYNTLIGDTVASVIANRSQLIEYGVSEEDINNAEQATSRLIAVLKPYNKLKTEKERFEYYRENYTEIKSQFMRLYSALHLLVNNGLVRMELTKKEKLQRYYQFVAQLYVISAGLDDELTYSEEWNVRGKKVTDVLEDVQIIPDNDCADPGDLTYPENDDQTIAPEKPEEPVFTVQQLLLEDEIKNGTLTQRTVDASLPLILKTSVVCEAEAAGFIRGDINGDKAVNNKDVVALFRAVSKDNYDNFELCDFNKDGAVNNKDVVALFRYVSAI